MEVCGACCVHMHHVDRVLRQYGGEQPVPRVPVDLTRFMTSTGRGEDRWWPDYLSTWYAGWQARGSRDVLVTIHECRDYRGTQEYFTCVRHPFERRVDHGEDAPAHGRRNDAGGRARRPPANAAPPRTPANSRDKRRRERMGVRVGMDEVQEEAAEISRREDEGDTRDQPHVSPAGPQWFDHDIIGSSSMMQASHASQSAVVAHPQPFPVASPDPFLQCTFDVGSLDDIFDMIRAPDTVVMSQAVSYRTSRDHHLDPSSSTFVTSPHPPHGMGYTVSDLGGTGAQYGTPPAYYDFMSGPIPTTTQAETAPMEPSPPLLPIDPRG
ncbi:hypothetical protein PIB30_036936 [Stylosanthes scabra]|uniref:Uncharacterized protein n=1 Tax=Stylosanthes scabra TaxID=79078 RepID=A0ABU6TDC6_9FABA|nr:hypothetical protein [Stylosanthes scabra]